MATAADILGSNGKPKIPRQWSSYYRRLCAERDRLWARDPSTLDKAPIALDDLTEGTFDEAERSIALVTTSATQDTLSEVIAAIGRIERGSFGICEITGQPIEPQRLEAIPWARYSLKGQKKLEKSGFVGKSGASLRPSAEKIESGPGRKPTRRGI